MKRIIRILPCFLTALCLQTAFMPEIALAAGTGKSMQQISADNPGGGIADGDHIYLGTKDEMNYTWMDDVPYWRVLDADEMNTGEAGMFVMSESLIGNNPGGENGNIYFNQDYKKGNAWQGSDARSWCGGFMTNVFSKEEQAAIASSDKDDAAYHYQDKEYDYDAHFNASSGILHGDRVFFLSAEEADSAAYGFTDNASRKENYGSKAGYWRLRSPSDSVPTPTLAGLVYLSGMIVESDVAVDGLAARPAFNIDLSSVLFSSAAKGGKSSGAPGADSLTPVSDYSGKDWKLTLIDSARSGFAAALDSMSGGVATIRYSGANAGTNEYISAVIVNSSGEIAYYGNLALAETGDRKTVTVDLAGKYNDGDTLYVFNEQANGDRKTDYSSELKIIEITAHVHSLKLAEAKQATCTKPGNKAYYTCGGCGHWFADATGLVEITDKSSVIIRPLGHKWDSGVVTKEATYTAEGIRTFTCLNDSSHTKTEPIPKKERRSSGSSDRDSSSGSSSSSSERSSSTFSGSWNQDASGWIYRENGTPVSNAWRLLPYNGQNYWYYFGENSFMQTGWLDWKGERYYLYPVSDGWKGRMLTGWQEIDGKWYYFETAAGNNQGRMYRSEKTPDGYYVGADGVWDGIPANADR